MNETTIEQLLRRYYEGQTTEEEESRLADYFSQSEAGGSMYVDKQLFDALAPAEADVPEDMESKLSALIDSAEQSEAPRARRLWLRWTLSAAASVALLVTIGLNLKPDGHQESFVQDEATGQYEAYLSASETLLQFSDVLNEGLGYIEF